MLAVGRQATRSDFQLGIGLTFAGALMLLVSVFLPLSDSKQFIHVAENSLLRSPGDDEQVASEESE